MDLEFKKGQLLILKVAPYYEREYFYEITSAGDKLVRASLYHSPKVKKSWSREELETMFNLGIARIAKDHEKPRGGAEFSG
ncbi:MAG TPA: hypothetical protein PKC98_22065 [Candidatus Melainabacteria bacterium]|nr:hypothetical protein [Candidatus Melainabacteria bacterium]